MSDPAPPPPVQVAMPVVLVGLVVVVWALLMAGFLALIFRGVAFEFRAKAPTRHRAAWNRAFFAGSLASTLAQGFMLGLYVTGLQLSWTNIAFALLTAVFGRVAF